MDLKRAISGAYYSLFHALAKECADVIVGAGPSRDEAAWLATYRSLEHGLAKSACTRAGPLRMPPEIMTFARAFILLQEERHAADYDPSSTYTRLEVLAFVTLAEAAVASLASASRPARRASVASAMLRQTRR